VGKAVAFLEGEGYIKADVSGMAATTPGWRVNYDTCCWPLANLNHRPGSALELQTALRIKVPPAADGRHQAGKHPLVKQPPRSGRLEHHVRARSASTT
jgi:hypothetical protein